eukprot:13439785-Alexandrium_andersonii.AAC.1
MSASLVGSEMCIRDRRPSKAFRRAAHRAPRRGPCGPDRRASRRRGLGPVSYTHLTLPTICSV